MSNISEIFAKATTIQQLQEIRADILAEINAEFSKKRTALMQNTPKFKQVLFYNLTEPTEPPATYKRLQFVQGEVEFNTIEIKDNTFYI